jgi:hypothetical protein
MLPLSGFKGVDCHQNEPSFSFMQNIFDALLFIFALARHQNKNHICFTNTV